MSNLASAYSGLNVLDLSSRLSGAFAARLFGDLGADVVIAEPPGGHVLRRERPLHGGESPVHAYVNWNKRSSRYVDFSELHDLATAADVVVATDLKTAADLHAWLKPSAVLVVVTPHGGDGELHAAPGNNLTTSARSGWSYINRLRDEPPLQMPRHQSGYIGGIAGYIAASAALLRRHTESIAERVDVSELEAFAHTAHPWAIMSIYAGQEDCFGPVGWRPRGALSPLWPAGGGDVHLAIGDFHNWTEAMSFLGLPELGKDPELIVDYGRHGRDLREVVEKLGDVLPDIDRWTAFHALAQLRCVIGVVQNMQDLGQDAQFRARKFLVDFEVDGASVRAPGAPFRLMPAPWRLVNPAPSQGQHRLKFKPARFKAQPQTASDRQGPLAGCRVLSFGQAWSGAFAAETLAFLGADVVQVASLQRPDVWRRVRTGVPEGVRDEAKRQHPLNTSGLFNSVNLNSRELTLNMKAPEGMALFWRLVANFDVVLDNFRATVMPGWGVSLDKLNAVRPGIIWASISGYGSDGPYSDYPANGASTEPMSGFSSLHGYEGDTGMNTAGLYPDPVSGYLLSAGIVSALHHRNLTGAPQRVDLAMMEAVSVLCGDAFVEYQLSGNVPGPMGNRHPNYAPHNHYRCAGDEWLALAVETDAQWQVLADLIGGELVETKWRSSAFRKAAEAELDQLIENYCADRSAQQLEQRFSAAGLIAARVVPLHELYSNVDTALFRNGFIQKVMHPEAGASLLPGAPWHFSASDAVRLRSAPCVGEHSRQLLREELGINDADYRNLVSQGITGTLQEYAELKQ